MLKSILKKLLPLKCCVFLKSLFVILFANFGSYARWVKKNGTLNEEEKKHRGLVAAQFAYKPLISIVMPVYKPDSIFFTQAIESVLAQIYQNWECILVEDASQSSDAKKIMDRFSKQDRRVKPIFLEKNQGISGATNEGIKLAQGEFIAFVDHDDLLTPDALYEVVKALNEAPFDILYSDSDHITGRNHRFDPFFKPDWDPYLFLFQHYLCHLYVARKSLIEEVGGLRTALNGSQDWDLALRLSEKTDSIYHIPKILYHWRRLMRGSFSQQYQEKTELAARNAVSEHLARRKIVAQVLKSGKMPYPDIFFALPDHKPFVSIFIASHGDPALLAQCLASLTIKNKLIDFEVIVLNQKDLDVTQAHGEVLLFLDDRLEAMTDEWIGEMLSVLLQSDVGVVGAKLYHPNLTIQHAGILLNSQGDPVYVHALARQNSNAYYSGLHLMRCFDAVSGACMMVKKKLFEQIGPVKSDIDLCLQIKELGCFTVFNPHVELRYVN